MTTPRHRHCYFSSFKTGQALVAGDSSILAKTSETSSWLLQSNRSCQTKQTISVPGLFRLTGGRFRSKTIKEGMGIRRNSKNLKCLLSYLYFYVTYTLLFNPHNKLHNYYYYVHFIYGGGGELRFRDL